jgi:hypothetical protein
MSTNATVVTPAKKLSLSEDWVVVILGFAIIILFLSGVVFAAPAYSWKNSDELFSKILSGENLFRMLLQFVTVYVFSALVDCSRINQSEA